MKAHKRSTQCVPLMLANVDGDLVNFLSRSCKDFPLPDYRHTRDRQYRSIQQGLGFLSASPFGWLRTKATPKKFGLWFNVSPDRRFDSASRSQSPEVANV